MSGHPGANAPFAPGQRPAAAVRVVKESRYAAQKRARSEEASAAGGGEEKKGEDVNMEPIEGLQPPPLEPEKRAKDDAEEEEDVSEEDSIMTSSVVEREPMAGSGSFLAPFPTTAHSSAFPAVKHRSEDVKMLSRPPVNEVAKHPVLDAFLSQRTEEYTAADIDKTNAKVLSSMSQETILEEQRELLSKLNPKLIDVLRRRGKEKAEKQASPVTKTTTTAATSQTTTAPPTTVMSTPKLEEHVALHNIDKAESFTIPKLEADKLAWMYLPSEPVEGGALRFDFEGRLVAPGASVAPHEGLHHHGENPQAAGYSLKELFLLARSSVAAQRAIAIQTICRVLEGCRSPEMKAADVRHRLDSLNVAVLLRCALDDTQISVLLPTLAAVHALISEPGTEEAYARVAALHRGWEVQPTYSDSEELVDEELEGSELSDADLAREDALVGLLRMGLLLRLRFLLAAHRAVRAIYERIRDVLFALARHSAHTALHVIQCPGFLPLFLSLALDANQPDPHAVRLLRAFAQASRTITEKLASEGSILALNKYILQPSTTPEGDVLFTETMLFWRVCVEYGLNASLFLDLFPSLAQRLTSLDSSPRSAHIASVIFCTGESLVHASARGAGLSWPQPLALIDPALAFLAQLRALTTATADKLLLAASAASYLASYFEHCTTQAAYTPSGNSQLVSQHVLPLCFSPLLSTTFASLFTFSAATMDLTQLPFIACCELVSAVARLCTCVRQVQPELLASLQTQQGAPFVEKLQRLCIVLCQNLPMPATREDLLGSSSLSLRPPVRMLQYVFALLAVLPPPLDPAFHHAAMSFIPRLLPGDETSFADIVAGVVLNHKFAATKTTFPLLIECFMLRYCPDRVFRRSLAFASSDVTSRSTLMLPISHAVLPAPAAWLLMPLSLAFDIVQRGEAIPPRHARAIRELFAFLVHHPPGIVEGPVGPKPEVCLLEVCKYFLLEMEQTSNSSTIIDEQLKRILLHYPPLPLAFDQNAPGAFAIWLKLIEQYAAASFGDPLFTSYMYLFLTCAEPVEYRKALYVSQPHALALVGNCEPPLALSRYLSPPDTDEAQLRALVNAIADERLVPPTALYKAALHHLASAIFRSSSEQFSTFQLCRFIVSMWSSNPHALVALLETRDADNTQNLARAERLKLFESAVAEDEALKETYHKAISSRP